MNILEQNEKFGTPEKFDVGITDRLAALARVPAHLVDAAISVAVGMAGETSANALAEMIEGKKSATGSHQIVDSLRAAYQGLKVILGREPKASEYVDNVTGPLTAAMQWLRVGYAEGGATQRFALQLGLRNAVATLRRLDSNTNPLAALADAIEQEMETGSPAFWAQLAVDVGGLASRASDPAIRDELWRVTWVLRGEAGAFRHTDPAPRTRFNARAKMPTSQAFHELEAKGAALAFSDAPWNELANGLTGDARAWVERAKSESAGGSLSGARQALREAERRAGKDAGKVKAFRERLFFDPTNWPPTRSEALQVLRDAAANPDLAPGQRTVVANALATLEGGAALAPAAEKKLLALGLKARHRGASLTDLAALTDYLAAGMFAFRQEGKPARFSAVSVGDRVVTTGSAWDVGTVTAVLPGGMVDVSWDYASAVIAVPVTSIRLAAPGEFVSSLSARLGADMEREAAVREGRYSADLPLWRFAMVAGGEEYMTRDEWKQRRADAGNPVANNPLGEFLSDAAELGVRWMGSGIVGVAKVGAALARLTGSAVAGLADSSLGHAARVVKEALRGSRRDIDAARDLIADGEIARAIGVLVMPTSDWNEPSVLERSKRFGEPEKFAGFPISVITSLPFFALWRLQEYAASAIWDGLSSGAQALVASLSNALAGGADPEAVAQAAEADPELARKLPARGPNGRFIRAMREDFADDDQAASAATQAAIDAAPSQWKADLANLLRRQPGWFWRQLTGTAAATAAFAAIAPPSIPLYILGGIASAAWTAWANHNWTARAENNEPKLLGIFGEPWEPMVEFDESAWSGELVSFEEKRRRSEKFATKHDSKGRFAPGKGGGGGAKKSAKIKGRQAEPEGDLDHTSGGPKGSPEKHKVQSKRLIDYIKRRGPKRHAEGDVLARNAQFAS